MGGRGSGSSTPGDTSDPKDQGGSSSDSLRKQVDKAASEEEKNGIITGWIEQHESAGTETIINPVMELEYECYSVTIDGIKIYYETPNDAAFAAIRALISGNKIPDRLKEHIDAIMLIPDQKPGSPITIATEKNGTITIFEDRLVDTGTLAHEMSHALAEDIWSSALPPAESDYMAAINSGEPPVSAYGGKDASEDFAEAVRMYITDKAGFKSGWPRRFVVVDKVIRNRNYKG